MSELAVDAPKVSEPVEEVLEAVPEIEQSAPAADAPAEDATMDKSDEEKKQRALRQVEFYFCDSNLPYDRHMWMLHSNTAEHWVPIKTVASFKRMREFGSLGYDWLVDALRRSEELEVDEKGENIRRRSEVRQPKGQFERSIYAKGFGKETPELQKELEAFFDKFGRTNAVRMRRIQESKEFKGSVFVEFSDMSAVERFLNADPKPTWKGQELLIMSKDAYCEMKIKEKGLSGKEAVLRRSAATAHQAGAGRSFNAFRDMGIETAGKRKAEEKRPEVWLDFMGNRILVHEEPAPEGVVGTVKAEEVPYLKGSTLRFTGCGGDLVFSEIRDPVRDRFNRAPFTKFEKGEDTGIVGFDRALSEEDIAFVKENIKTINGKEVVWTPLEEEEERQFILARAQTAARHAFSGATRGRGYGRGYGRGGTTRGRGGRGDRGGGRGGGPRGGGRGGAKFNKGGVEKATTTDAKPKSDDEEVGEKRKRPVEPDGAADTGVRGGGVPVVLSSKKSKTEGEGES